MLEVKVVFYRDNPCKNTSWSGMCLVCLGCYNSTPQMGLLTCNRKTLLTVSGARSPRSCTGLFGAWGELTSGSSHTSSHSGRGEGSSLGLFLGNMNAIHGGRVHPHNFIASKHPPCKYSHVGDYIAVYEFQWGLVALRFLTVTGHNTRHPQFKGDV